MRILMIIMVLILNQDTPLNEFGNTLFENLINNKVDTIMQLKINKGDLNSIKFNRKISDEKKQAFFDDLMSDEEELLKLPLCNSNKKCETLNSILPN